MRKIKTSRRFDKDLQKFGLSAPLIDVLGHLLHGAGCPKNTVITPLRGTGKITATATSSPTRC